LIALVLSLYAVMALFTVVSSGLATLFGAQIKAVHFGWPRVFNLGVWRIGLIPITSSLELPGRADLDDADAAWFRLSLGRRLAIALLPWPAYALPALLLLGPDHATSSIAHAWRQLFVTLDTTPLFRQLFVFIRNAPAPAIFGVVFAKCFVANSPIFVQNLLHELRVKRAWWLTLLMLWVGGRLAWGLIRAAF
jgi:hypothetical protein